ncbi:alpha/beta hydrolase [Leucobacter manosquensis]|uniref:Alpha/beta hydrolase n=1 Tax=Leucobacter manosquensis TaxID=2810611 RepID=A0ABS5M7N0_9MICO|nr:alpha/beta hydrolase [Leucobacter manosquensis]MBS3182641.1 alpha/beta hydrolase [Leucobacter manosquensis]
MDHGGVSARHGRSARPSAAARDPAPAGPHTDRSATTLPAEAPQPTVVETREPLSWRPDILGPGFEAAELDLGADDEGPLVATLVRCLPDDRSLLDRVLHRTRVLEDVDVLYVHGWSDYFFQRTMARFWTDRGARFYALDLRKYGRSLRDGQTPGYIENLDEYDLEIGMALDALGHPERGSDETQRGPGSERKLMLFGHSTGGLVLSLWASRHSGRADGLVLNSPWLEFQLTGAGRQMLAPLLDLGARFNLRDSAPQFDAGLYTRAQREVGPADELDLIDERWRPTRSHAVLTVWLRAILAGHARVSRGLGIEAPMMMLLSARSALPLKWDPSLTSADTVLEVDEIAKASLRLGASLTIERLDGALHDVFLSRDAVRAEAYQRLDRWLVGWAAARGQRSRRPTD